MSIDRVASWAHHTRRLLELWSCDELREARRRLEEITALIDLVLSAPGVGPGDRQRLEEMKQLAQQALDDVQRAIKQLCT